MVFRPQVLKPFLNHFRKGFLFCSFRESGSPVSTDRPVSGTQKPFRFFGKAFLLRSPVILQLDWAWRKINWIGIQQSNDPEKSHFDITRESTCLLISSNTPLYLIRLFLISIHRSSLKISLFPVAWLIRTLSPFSLDSLTWAKLFLVSITSLLYDSKNLSIPIGVAFLDVSLYSLLIHFALWNDVKILESLIFSANEIAP